MFTGFFYIIRGMGVPVSLTEWITFMSALDKGLGFSSLTQFYRLARAILVKSEAYYDSFDRAFLKFFGGIETSAEMVSEALKWVEKSLPPLNITSAERACFEDWDFEELRRNLEGRMEQQDSEHHGGSYWIGTGGTSPYGHSGYNPAGVRIGGQSINRSAVQVASERSFRDFRKDEVLNTRHFQTALRSLRRLSRHEEGPKEVLDLESTIEATGSNAGNLKLVWNRPRKNNVKLMILMDSGGSMNRYARLCSQLFQAANKADHFKEFKVYFFHNCIYEHLFHEPFCRVQASQRTLEVLNTHAHDYKVILVGDASMATSELMMKYGALEWNYLNNEPGISWLRHIVNHFRHVVWLNPIPKKIWPTTEGANTIDIISGIVPMFELTLEGLQKAIKRLTVIE
ncbi:MAG: VWA domain-containing protein [Firmicutes bacterium]|nr:VWA domain-containing protein [Bacillota bacterium]